MKGKQWVIGAVAFFALSGVAFAQAPIFCTKENFHYVQDGHKLFGDWIPWPMGSECAVPWRKLEGSWFHPQDAELGRLDIDVSILMDSERFVTVRRFSSDGSMLEEGVGFTEYTEKVIAVTMYSTDPGKRPYTLFIRHFAEEGSCDGKLATVITIRKDPKNCENDVNLIMKKVQKKQSTRPKTLAK